MERKLRSESQQLLMINSPTGPDGIRYGVLKFPSVRHFLATIFNKSSMASIHVLPGESVEQYFSTRKEVLMIHHIVQLPYPVASAKYFIQY